MIWSKRFDQIAKGDFSEVPTTLLMRCSMDKRRNIGLDLARLTAIILVWVGHSGFFSIGMNPKFMEYCGVVCLEVFFVLSGFLVGKSMLLMVAEDNLELSIKKFYTNRILRTIPMYYLLLLVMWVLSGSRPPLSCFLFLQNFSAEDLGYLAPSWSLSVEAWFYFLIPPLLLGLIRLFSRKFDQKKAVFLGIAVLCIIPFLLRTAEVLIHDPVWDFGVRKQIPLRLDSPMLGLLLAAVKLYEPKTYYTIGKSHFSILIGVAGLLALYGWYLADLRENFDDSNTGRILLFTILPALCCLIIAYLENSAFLEKLRGTFVEKVICGVSTLGYGSYLLHWGIFQAVARYFEGARFLVSWMGFFLAIALTLIASWVAYRLIEEPMSKLRERIFLKL